MNRPEKGETTPASLSSEATRVPEIALDIPLLAGESPEQRLQTLRWMTQAPGSKVVSLFGDLRTATKASYYEREAIARERLGREIARLEREGVSAPVMSSHVAIARIEATTLSPEAWTAVQTIH